MPNQLLTNVLNNLIAFRSMIETKNAYKEELIDLNQLIENISAPLNVMVMGEFSTGKSTFINALLGQEVVKMAITPTTAVITKLCFGSKDTITVYFKNGRCRECSVEEFNDLTATTDGVINTIHAEIDYVERKLPIEKLKKITIIDSPGLNAIRREDEKITRQFIENADTILLLYDINKMNSKLENDLLNNLNERLQPIGIANKIDDFDEDEEEESLEEFLDEQKKIIGDKISNLIGVSAKQALKGKLTHDQNLIKESNILNVEQTIDSTLNNTDTYKFYSLLDKISNLLSTFGNLANKNIKNNKQSDTLNYAYIQKQSDILNIMNKLNDIAKIIYEFTATHKINASSNLFLGILYYHGILFTQDINKSFQYLEASAHKNNDIAQLLLCQWYFEHSIFDKLIYWCRELVKQNNVYGQNLMAYCYANGLGLEKNLVESFKYYQIAAQQNNAKAQYELASYYDRGIGTTLNKNEAYKWYLKSAQQNYTKAQFELGLCYHLGRGIRANENKAIFWLEKAAKNSIEANNLLQQILKKRALIPKCPNCGNIVRPDDNFCTNCGSPIKNANDNFDIIAEDLSNLAQEGFNKLKKSAFKAFDWYEKNYKK